MKEFVKKKAVIVKDRLGLPNYMTMFYMEPGTYSPEDVPDKDEAPDWTVAEVNGKPLKLYGSSDGGVVMSTAEKIEKDWDDCHIAELQLEELEDVPEIAYKLGIVPHDWKNETAGIWADRGLAVPVRGSGFRNTSHGGAGALNLGLARSGVGGGVSLRSALFLESWELVTDLLKAGAEAHAGAQDE